jgi:hypothetical protein
MLSRRTDVGSGTIAASILAEKETSCSEPPEDKSWIMPGIVPCNTFVVEKTLLVGDDPVSGESIYEMPLN